MSITRVALEGKFINADGSPASGTICARLNTELSNTPETVSPSVICGLLDGEGRIIGQDQRALVLYATDDAGTYPVGSTYTLTLELDGEMPVEFATPVPHAPAVWGGLVPVTCQDPAATTTISTEVVQLVHLVASFSMVGATVTGNHFTGSVTITAVDPAANTITVSANATTSGVDTALTIAGGCVELAALRENAL